MIVGPAGAFIGPLAYKSSAFSPLAMPSLLAWFAVDKGLTQSSGKVSAWANQIISGPSASQSTGTLQPTYNATAFNGGPCVTFNGSSQYMALSSALASLNAFTVYYVGAILSSSYSWVGMGGADQSLIGTSSTSYYLIDGSNNRNFGTYTGSFSANVMHRYHRTGANQSFGFQGGGQAETSLGGTTINGINLAQIGRRATSALYSAGSFVDIYVFSADITGTAQGNQFETWLKNRWRLTF